MSAAWSCPIFLASSGLSGPKSPTTLILITSTGMFQPCAPGSEPGFYRDAASQPRQASGGTEKPHGLGARHGEGWVLALWGAAEARCQLSAHPVLGTPALRLGTSEALPGPSPGRNFSSFPGYLVFP